MEESLYKETESLYKKNAKIITISGYLPGLTGLEGDWSCQEKILENREKNRI
jgi:hypothetical protein